jgi:hypothetical protein
LAGLYQAEEVEEELAPEDNPESSALGSFCRI